MAYKMPPFKGLWYFRVAAQLGSFKLAAEALFVTQAAISQQIRALESALGCELFDRQVRKVTLTREGMALLPHLTQAFSQIEQGIEALQAEPQPNVLNLSVLSSFATCWLLPKMPLFNQVNPHLQLRIDPSDAQADFRNGDADIGIRFGLGEYPGLKSELIAEDTVLLVYKPGLIDPNKPLKAQLASLPFIQDICPDAQQAWTALNHDLGNREPKPSQMGIDNAALMLQAAVAGQGAAMLRKSLLEQAVSLGQLDVYPHFSWPCRYKYYLVAPAAHFEWPKVQAFRNWLIAQFMGGEQETLTAGAGGVLGNSMLNSSLE
ncbi:LysR family transcriptional regulator [Pseudoalteromonas rubra]|uniref:LysR family transcriptional regulator n=1 Tax=Pseudoalteromonas rubra TaxID=43658 RepID=A0A5S3WVF0_9GAMM|nr:LysR substrate-binding domain-containing protein [Pseudoalteromonas rubra]TMP31843.1 LysR family transcriptional regulator [Pseudoalteromonas rubra]TMP33074.1 LysR family transcriptional regulator [Pseudoalteromonas rubra]